jgi:CheY-like chemotaxis protein
MVRQALILSADRAYAGQLRQVLADSVFSQSGIDVETDPLRAMQLSPSSYDAIILDAQLGSMDGLQLLSLMKNQAPQTKFIAIGTQGNEIFRYQAYANGASLFINKPVEDSDWENLVRQFNEVFNPEAVVTPLSMPGENPGIAAADLLQTECLSGNSSLLHAEGPGGTGDIFIYRGDLFHAQCPGSTGEAALNQILSWGAGVRFDVHPLNHAPPRTIETDWRTLLAPAGGADETGYLPPPDPAVVSSEAPEQFPPSMDDAPPVLEGYALEPSRTDVPAPVPASNHPPVNGLAAHWKINLMGDLIEYQGIDALHESANLTFFLFQKLAEVAVALDQDYFNQMSLHGPKYRQEIVADNFGIRHGVFLNKETSEEDRRNYVEWCNAQSV